jgi:hypothetical protein
MAITETEEAELKLLKSNGHSIGAHFDPRVGTFSLLRIIVGVDKQYQHFDLCCWSEFLLS